MPGYLLHVGGIINCFHQSGIVTPSLINPPRVLVNETQQVLTTPELLTVAGCLFNVSGGPHPCVLVRVEAATRVKINGQPAAILTPTALCVAADQAPQGIPNSSSTKKRVIAT
jgi:uncharacterized Zn-binding protein involved in type VI secretion